MFSGGATLGLFHSGVCKALMEQDLMPKVLSGSSAGAIMAGMLGTSSPSEFQRILAGETFLVRLFAFGIQKICLEVMVGLQMSNTLKLF